MSEINLSENICRNCNHTFTKNYCNGCGQKNASRINSAHLVHEVMHVALHADMGVFPFVKKLIVSPGLLAKEYVDGKRKIFNPLQFLVLSVGLVMLLMSITHFYHNVELWQAKNLAATPPNMKEAEEKVKGFQSLIQKNGNVIILILMPIFAFFAKLLFKKQENNFAEHLMIAVFAVSMSNVLTSLMLIGGYFIEFNIVTILAMTFIITITSFTLTYKQFYRINWFTAIFKSLAIYLLAMLIEVAISAIISACILLLA